MKRLLLFTMALLFPAALHAQTINTTFEVGGGALFAEENQTFDTDALRASFQLAGVDLPFVEAGVVVEAGYSGGFVYEVWEANETMKGNVIVGAHLRVYRGGPFVDDSFDFDRRIVAGYRFNDNLAGRVYFLEEDRPIAFNMAWRF